MKRLVVLSVIGVAVAAIELLAMAEQPLLSLAGDYEIERYYNLGESEDLSVWTLDDPPRGVVIETTSDGVWISGNCSPSYCTQMGIRSCIPELTSVSSLECVVRFTIRSRDTALVLELMSWEVGCAMAQVRCNPAGFSFDATVEPCPSPHRYRESAYRSNWIEGMTEPGTYILRVMYDASIGKVKGYRQARFIGVEFLEWSPGDLGIRIFSEASENLQGEVDVTIEEIAIGWDPIQ